MEKIHYIYMITNNINNKKYIGVTHSPKRRFQEHCNTRKDYIITKSINKYGKENFTFVIIDKGCKEYCYIMEMILIYYHKTLISQNGYNNSTGGENTKGMLGKKHSEETKNKMSKKHLGKKLSPLHKKNISDGNIGKNLNEFTKNKISDSNKLTWNNNPKYGIMTGNCKISSEKCIEILIYINMQKYTLKEISILSNVSYDIVKSISCGKSWTYLQRFMTKKRFKSKTSDNTKKNIIEDIKLGIYSQLEISIRNNVSLSVVKNIKYNNKKLLD